MNFSFCVIFQEDAHLTTVRVRTRIGLTGFGNVGNDLTTQTYHGQEAWTSVFLSEILVLNSKTKMK